jgi:hypothetical protein
MELLHNDDAGGHQQQHDDQHDSVLPDKCHAGYLGPGRGIVQFAFARKGGVRGPPCSLYRPPFSSYWSNLRIPCNIWVMVPQVDTRVPGAVEEHVQSLYRKMFPQGDRAFVARVFDWAQECFTGRYDDYLPIDARYHDLEHTLQGTLCLVRLLFGRHKAQAQPQVSERMFQLTLLAILFHDTGYLKKRGDDDGTGAKYTPIHVGRSATFAMEFLSKKGFNASEIASIQNMISCTGVNIDLEGIPFDSELERTLGFALSTADLLGQMAARDYVDKLPILYAEFAEAARYNFGKTRFVFKSPDELMRNTPAFWEYYVWPKINNDFSGLYRYLNDPYPDGPNSYIVRIDQNLSKLRDKLAAVAQA